MSVHLIPLRPGVFDYIVGTQLIDTQYNLHVYWNDRDNAEAGAWYVDVLDASENPIAVGLKIVVRWYLGRTTQAPPFTTGVLICYDLTGLDQDPGLNDLGGRHQLYFVPEEDLVAIQAQVTLAAQAAAGG